MSNGTESQTPPPPATSDGLSGTPSIQQYVLPTPEEIKQQDVMNNCAIRSVISGAMGGGAGAVFGLFFGALDKPLNVEEMTGRQQFIFQAKQMGQRSWSSCKTFALMGLVFSAAECVAETVRAKHDATNSVVAGCVTGATLSAKAGPQAACFGCAGFAAFSALIDKYLG